MSRWLCSLALVAFVSPLRAGEPSAAERGYKALTETAFIPGFWKSGSIANAWKQWGVAEKPANYDDAFRERYGLHPAPYPNGDLPMGLRKTSILFKPAIGADCML